LRGSLGELLNAAAPRPAKRPSGLAEPPRPFALRAAHLDGRRFQPGETFAVNVHVFDLRPQLFEMLAEAFGGLARSGLGPGRALVELMQPVTSSRVEINLAKPLETARRIRIFFRTPTELKGHASSGEPAPGEIPFGVLFSRIRDRIATLSSLYAEPLPIDFQNLSNRARLVKTANSDLAYQHVSRRSSRTGAVHGIGGFTGTAEYEGDLTEFLPYLRAAWWTGAGRHTVWGNGVIEVAVLA